MPQLESREGLFAILHNQLIATGDHHDAERAEIINAMFKARGSDFIYDPKDRQLDLLEKRGMTGVTIGVSSRPTIRSEQDEQNLRGQGQRTQNVRSKALDELEIMQQELIQQLRDAEMEIFKPYCKEPEEFEACRKLMVGQDMTGWEVGTVFRIIQTNNLPVYFVPMDWLRH